MKKLPKEKIGKIAKDGTDDLTFNLKPAYSVKQKILKLPNSYTNWKEIKQELQLIKSQQCSTIKDIIASFTQITKLTQKSSVSANAIKCFVGFLEKGFHSEGKSQQQQQKGQDVKQQKDQEDDDKEVPVKAQQSQQQEKFLPQKDHSKVVSPFIKPFYFINTIMPYIASVALQIEELFPSGQISMLITATNSKIQLTKMQVACILAHQFLCTLNDTAQERSFPSTFLTLMKMTFKPSSYHPQKFLCISHYFDRMLNKQHSKQVITFQRICIEKQQYRGKLSIENWLTNDTPLSNAKYYDDRMQAHQTQGSIYVDFANQMIGGGSLRMGCVQEEILFVVMPECLVSIPLCERMYGNEAIVITGVQRFVDYTGYANTFKVTKAIWENDKKIPRRMPAINAMKMGMFPGAGQFSKKCVERELNKAYAGFIGSRDTNTKQDGRDSVVTGKWGCGAFKGHPELKFIIQWIVVSKLSKKMLFCGFGDSIFKNVNDLIKLLIKQKHTVGSLLRKVFKYSEMPDCGKDKFPLFKYLADK